MKKFDLLDGFGTCTLNLSKTIALADLMTKQYFQDTVQEEHARLYGQHHDQMCLVFSNLTDLLFELRDNLEECQLLAERLPDDAPPNILPFKPSETDR